MPLWLTVVILGASVTAWLLKERIEKQSALYPEPIPKRPDSSDEVLRAAAQRLDLPFSGRIVDGQLAGCRVRISHGPNGIRFRVGPLSGDIALTGRLLALEERSLTGDPAFDAVATVRGSETTWRALLDWRARGRWREALAAHRGLALTGGELELDDTRCRESPAEIERIARQLADLASSMHVDGTEVAKLALNARTDLSPGVRLQCLMLLISRFPQSPETVGAAREALTDGDPHRRRHAAMFLGQEGWPALEELVLDVAASDDGAEHVHAALRHLPKERSNELARRVLAAGPSEAVAHVVLPLCDRKEDAAALASFLARGVSPSIAERLCLTLGRIGDPVAESALLAMIEREDGARLAAIRALATAGTLRAVERLRALTKLSVFPSDVSRAAEETIAKLQERGEAGALSVVDPAGEHGRVAIVTTQGALSSAGGKLSKP